MNTPDELDDATPVNSTHPTRPGTPDSSLTGSFYRANATIDDLTSNLAKISRATSPDRDLLQCCCGRDDCEHLKAWIALQAKLESRLVLSAEVGQALLQKHEAYVRRHEANMHHYESHRQVDTEPTLRMASGDAGSVQENERLLLRIDQLTLDNAALEKKLNVALLNCEVQESSTNVILQDLGAAKATISELTIRQARSVGWETRLNSALQEKDDVRQEREVERQRVKSGEAHITVLRERCSKMQTEINRLHDELEQQKVSRTELSEEILRDARARLQMLLQSQIGRATVTEQPEVTEVMQSLVAENEALKRDIAELQNLLAESREDLRVAKEDLEEANVDSLTLPKDSVKAIPGHVRPSHGHTASWGSSFGQDYRTLIPNSSQVPLNRQFSPAMQRSRSDGSRRPVSAGPASSTSYEPPTPASSRRPLSPANSNAPSEEKLFSFPGPRPRYPPLQLSIEVDSKSSGANTPGSPEKPKTPRRPLYLLTQSRGVQTDGPHWTGSGLLRDSLKPPSLSDRSSSTPPTECRSESSSLVDTHSSTMATLIDRVSSLFNRVTQADARTLTNRLKRQHLTGADVGHISRATVSAILADVNSLRKYFKAVLEDEKVLTTCTRRDLRSLLSLLKEIFTELGQMRVTLNAVILDPSIAPRVREEAMNPSRDSGIERTLSPAKGMPALSGWIAPITKLFATSGGTSDERPRETPPTPSRSALGAPQRPRPPRFAPMKIGPALAASTTTVNVEFSGMGVGRSVSSTVPNSTPGSTSLVRPVPITPGTSRAVMGIFAGAPRPPDADPWVVVGPKPQRRLRGEPSTPYFKGTATLSRTAGRRMGPQRISRNVAAVIDADSAIHSEESDDESNAAGNWGGTLLERTLRPRGLSDSSIHSTFMDSATNEADGAGTTATRRAPPSTMFSSGPSTRQGAYPIRQSVLQTLTRTMQGFKAAPPAGVTQTPARAEVANPADASGAHQEGAGPIHREREEGPPSGTVPSSPPPGSVSIHAMSPRRKEFLPSFASWAAATAGLDTDMRDTFVGSVQEESGFNRTWHRSVQERDL